MTTIKTDIRINAPKDEVWKVLADLGGIQSYNSAVKKSYYNTEAKEGIGAGRVCELAPMGEVEEKAIAWTDQESYTLDVKPVDGNPPLKSAQASFVLKEDGNQTIVTMEMNYELKFGPIGKLMDTLMMKPQFAKVVPNILLGLKHHIETGEEVDGAVIKRLHSQGLNASPTYA